MDMSQVITPKSDQINADDLLAGPMTITITGVKIKGGQEQPVSIAFAGTDKVFRPCKSMCRVMVAAWGADTSAYTGRSMTLYCDPSVKWAGMAVGGIRISHMSDIGSAMTFSLTVTRANRKPFTVKPLAVNQSIAAAQTPISASLGAEAGEALAHFPVANADASTDNPPVSAAAQYITPDQALTLECRFSENDIGHLSFFKKAGVNRFSQILVADYQRACDYVDAVLSKRKEET